MAEVFAPNLFLFQSYVQEVLKEGKKIIKTAPFDTLDPQTLLSSQKTQALDLYHGYFLAAMSHTKTRELACTNYEKLLRQGLFDRDRLPSALVSSILTACASTGAAGSTSGSSSLGSTSLSGGEKSQTLYVGNLLKSILLFTHQPPSETALALNYLLEGTRKKYAILFTAMLDEAYQGLLPKLREPPLRQLVRGYLQGLLDEVQAHFEDNNYRFASRQMDQRTGKIDMALYSEGGGYGKFGKCCVCRKQANHYTKEENAPICSIICRNRFKELTQQTNSAEHFSLLDWIVDSLPLGDQIISSFLIKQLNYALGKHCLSVQQLLSIIKATALLYDQSNLTKYLFPVLALIIANWQTLIPVASIDGELVQTLQNHFKVCLLQILHQVEESPVSARGMDAIMCFSELLRDQSIFFNIFTRYDSHFLQPNIVGRMLNIISQYAKKDMSEAVGSMQKILRMLVERYIQKGRRNEEWQLAEECLRKRQFKRMIALFNKKPINGIKYLKKMFQNNEKEQVQAAQPIQRREKVQSLKSMEEDSLVQRKLKETQMIQVERQFKQKGERNLQEQTVGQTQQEGRLSSPRTQQQTRQLTPKKEPYIKEGELIQQKEYQNKPEKTFQQAKDKQNEQEQGIKHEVKQQKIQGQAIQHGNKQQNIQQSSIQPQQEQTKQGYVSPDKYKQKSQKQSPYKHQQKPPNKQMYTKITPEDIALILRQNTQFKNTQPESTLPIQPLQLRQAMVGEYFGTNSPEVRQVCRAFLATFPLQQLQIDETMRVILNSFSLPKETQMVQRIIEDIAHRLVGMYGLQNDTESYQYFYLLLMVQTTNHNPNVRENQKLKMDSFLKMCKDMMGRVPENAERHYKKIIDNSLNNRIKYDEQTLFHNKYLGNMEEQGQRLFENSQPGSQSKTLLLYIWEYLVVGLIWPGNTRGLFEAVVLLGREGLASQQKGFFEALRKQARPQDARMALLKLGMQYGNDLHGRIWDHVVALIYDLQNQNEYSSGVLDKLFTNSATLSPLRLKDFLQSLLLFSGAQFRKDAHYNRELFVLRHINSVLEYNMRRFDEVAAHIWPLLQNYFKDVCLHPRKQVAMGGVDSLKQLTLKLTKIRRQPVPHDALIETFRYVFERSGLEMKDLIANVLLNLITPDLRGGWDPLYEILDILDTRDKQLVALILSRLAGEVGLANLSSLPKLHTICIKELRVCNNRSALQQLLQRIWQLSQFINSAQTWLQTMRSIKDIFKMSLDLKLLSVFVRMANRCLKGSLLERQIYGQLIDLTIFLVQMKGGSKSADIVTGSLQTLGQIQAQFVARYLGGTSGLLSVWQLFFTSPQKLSFAIFLKDYLASSLLGALSGSQFVLQLEQLSIWCVNQYYDHLPLELVNLKDPDFKKTLSDIIEQNLSESKEESGQLIEFNFSHRDYNEKSAMHLIFLDIIRQIYRHLSIRCQHEPLLRAVKKIEQATLDSYNIAAKINRSVLLRVFLWNNGFMGGRNLPGLHKQEHRTLAFILSQFPLSKGYLLFEAFLEQYLATAHCLSKLRKIQKEEQQNKHKQGQNKHNQEQGKQKEGRWMVQVYAEDARLWLQQAEKCLSVGLGCIRLSLSRESSVGNVINSGSGSDNGLIKIGRLCELCVGVLQLGIGGRICEQVCETLSVLYSILYQ